MYWPTAAARAHLFPPPLDHEPAIVIKPSRRGNLFATLGKSTIGVWDVRPTVLQGAVVRTAKSLERWGENQDVFWAHDGKALVVLTTTSHLLCYNLVPSAGPSYEPPPTPFPPGYGAGEAPPLQAYTLVSLGVAFAMGAVQFVLAQSHSLLVLLRHPQSILLVPWPLPPSLLSPPGSHFPPAPLDGEGEEQVGIESWELAKGADWIDYETQPPVPQALSVNRTHGLPTVYTLLCDDGRAYAFHLSSQTRIETTDAGSPLPPHQAASYFPSPSASKYFGHAIHPVRAPLDRSPVQGVAALGLVDAPPALADIDKAVTVSLNPRFGQVAVGLASGLVNIVGLPTPPQPPRLSHTLDLKHSANLRISPGAVKTLTWTSDGYALTVGYERGWAVWSMGGRLGGWGLASDEPQEAYMSGIVSCFWVPGNLELFALSAPDASAEQLFAIPFAKSATTSQHSPDNTRYAFLQKDDRVLVYRGADQPDMSVINPESDVWQHIKIPDMYIASNWPIRYAAISQDGRLIAVAGRRGLTHYSASSGRWKLFAHERDERAFTVRGGLLWFHHVLVVAVEVDKTFQIRLYSRDLDLSDTTILHAQPITSPVLVMTLLDNSLLVYTADNTLYHYLILPTKETIRLHLCGSISFDGIVPAPTRVRALSWLVPQAQKELGDPADDLIVATIIFLVDGKLVLLRPRRAGNDEVRYDLQTLADRIEAYWTHLHGVGTLENSLWGYDGQAMRVWLDALTIESTRIDVGRDAYESVEESVKLRLDFYPLSILMDKGIIIGVDHEASTRSLPFALFKIQTGTHLFLPQFLRFHLAAAPALDTALAFAANYAGLVYFAHALEILLHSVLEDDDAGEDAADHELVVPDMDASEDADAHALSEGEPGSERVRSPPVLRARMRSRRHTQLARVVAFLDHFSAALDVVVGCARKTEPERWAALFGVVGRPRDLFERCLAAGRLRTAASYLLVLHSLEALELDGLNRAGATNEVHGGATDDNKTPLPQTPTPADAHDTVRLVRAAMAAGEFQLCKELLRFLRSIDETGVALRTALDEIGILDPAPTSPEPVVMPAGASIAGAPAATLEQPTPRPDVPSPAPAPAASAPMAAAPAPAPAPGSPRTPQAAPTPPDPSPSGSRVHILRTESGERATSPFQLSSPRMYSSPPSPRTVDMQPLAVPDFGPEPGAADSPDS
ncbi:WD40 repeat protein [Cryptotrichosporon argae]